jgi:hypothetical protein
MFLQASCQMFVDRSAWLELPISVNSVVQIHFISMMCHIALTLLIFIAFCVFNDIMNYDQSKRVIKVGAFDRRLAFCGGSKLSFNRDRHSTSCFKIVSRSQKVNYLFWYKLLTF